jgi:hypothetical protein
MAIKPVAGYGSTGKKKTVVAPAGLPMTAAQSAVRTARGEPGVGSTLPALKSIVPKGPGSIITAPPPSYGPGVPASSAALGSLGPAAPDGTVFNANDPYSTELTSDPLYQDALKNYNDQLAAGRLALTQALKQGVIRGGWGDFGATLQNTPGLSGYAGDVDQATLDAAQANQFSDRAQLQQQLDKGLGAIPYSLSGRGMLRSGANAVAARNVQDQYDVASNTARQNLIDALTGNVNTYTGNAASLLAAFQGQQGDVATRLGQQRGYSQPTDASGYPTTTLPAPFSASTSTGGPSPKTAATVAKVKAAVKAKKAAPGMTVAATQAMARAAGQKSARY